MELSSAVEFARRTRQSVLVTLRDDGRPQLSNVLHRVDEAGTVTVSVTADRAKYKNLRKRPWAALHVTREDFWAYAVLEGDVELSPVAAAPDDAVVEALVEHYRALAGEHPDWDDYRRAQVSEGRALVRLRPTRAYGLLGRS
jgi:PPOX class probable F420-dependent enzyme